MKTVLILIPDGLTVRNFVPTGVLNKLAARPDVRVVALTKSPEVVARYPGSAPHVLFKPFPGQSRYTLSRLLHRALAARFDRVHENRTLQIMERTQRVEEPGTWLLESLLSQPLPRSKTIYDRMRAFAHELPGGVPDGVRALFDRYRPSLVVSTNPSRMGQCSFLKHARQTGVTTVGVIKSWDVILTKGYLPASTDYYLVWTPAMKQDLVRVYGVRAEAVGLTGIPQFDIYAEPPPASGRAGFFRRYGLDPSKKTVLFSTTSPQLGVDEPQILDRLARVLGERATERVQILARLHAIDDPSRFRNIRHPNLAYHIPAAQSANNADSRFLDAEYIPLLRDTIASVDVVLNTASTMALDAAALDKPVVNLALDLEPTDYYQSSKRFYEFDHYQPIVQSGAVKIASSFDELVALTFRYLVHPEFERDERTRLRETMCYKLDGRSAQRVADHLLCVLDGEPFSALAPLT